MLKIRLMRIGARKMPFYRIVAVDERAKRTGSYLELLGTYNPLTEPKDIKLKQDRIDYWIKKGAQPSTGYLRIIGKAPQRPPRKPKKERKSDETAPQTPQTAEPAAAPAEPVVPSGQAEEPSEPSEQPAEPEQTETANGEASKKEEEKKE